jgi:hypothetical protein
LVVGERLPWILLATEGDGVESERWTPVADHPVWMDYELCRHNDAGEVRWTWRRTKAEMTQLYAELGEDLARKRYGKVKRRHPRLLKVGGALNRLEDRARILGGSHLPKANRQSSAQSPEANGQHV